VENSTTYSQNLLPNSLFSKKYPNGIITKAELIEEICQLGGNMKMWERIISFIYDLDTSLSESKNDFLQFQGCFTVPLYLFFFFLSHLLKKKMSFWD